MAFTIGNKYIDLRNANPGVARKEAEDGNPFAMAQLAHLEWGRFGHNIEFGLNVAFDSISKFNWSAHPISTACYAYIFDQASRMPSAEIKREFKKIITPEFVEELARHAGEGYYHQLYTGLYIGSGLGFPPKRQLDFFPRAYRYLQPLAQPAPVDINQVDNISGDGTARWILRSVFLVEAEFTRDARRKAWLHAQAGLNLLASAEDGHVGAQTAIGDHILKTDPKIPLFPTLTVRGERLDLGEKYLTMADSRKSPTAKYLLAQIYKESGRWAEAEPLLRQSLDYADIVCLELKTVLDALGRSDEIEPILRQLSTGSNKIAPSLLGFMLKTDGKIDEAKSVLHNALLINDNNSTARLALADIYDEAGDYEAAYNLYTRILQDVVIDVKNVDDVNANIKKVAFKLLEYYTNRESMPVVVNDEAALDIADGALTVASKGYIQLTLEERGRLNTIRTAIRNRAWIVDKQKLRRVNSKDVLTVKSGARFIIMSPDPQRSSDAIEGIISSGVNAPKDLIIELVKLTTNIPALTRRWNLRGAEVGYPQSLETAIAWHFKGTEDFESNWVEALRLCRLALIDERKGGVPRTSGARTEITTIYKEIMAQEPGSRPRLWVEGRDGLRPIKEDSDKLKNVKVAPTEPDLSLAFYLEIAENGSETARLIAEEIKKEIQASAAVDEEETLQRAEQEAETARIEVLSVEALLPPEPHTEFQSLTLAHNTIVLQLAEHFAGIKKGTEKDLVAANLQYNYLLQTFLHHPGDFPTDAETRLIQLRQTILEDAWIKTAEGLKKVRHGVGQDIKLNDDDEVLVFAPGNAGYEDLLEHSGSSADVDVEIALRSPDLLLAFRTASDLLLDRDIFAMQDPKSYEPLPMNFPKREKLQELWDEVAGLLIFGKPDDLGNVEFYLPPEYQTNAPKFLVLADALDDFRNFLKQASDRRSAAPEPT